MFRALLIVSTLTFIASAQSSGKGYRTIIHSSFPIDAPLQFDPNNDERLVLSIVKPLPDGPNKTDDKHRLRIINIDHKLAEQNPSQKEKTTKSVSVSARLTEQNESKQSKSATESRIFNKEPDIDYGLPRIRQKDDSILFASPEMKYISQKLESSGPSASRLFVSKMPSVEELLEKGYVLSDVYPLEFTSDDSEFGFPTDRFFRLPPNNVDGQLRTPQKQNKQESETLFQSKIRSNVADEDGKVDTDRPPEVKYNFLPKADRADFYLGKKFISKFVNPAASYETPPAEAQSFDIRRTIKNKQGMSTQPTAKNEKAEMDSFVSSKSQSGGATVGSKAKAQEESQSEINLRSKDEDKTAFISSVFGNSSAESEGVKSRLSSSESQSTKSFDAKLYQNPTATSERVALPSTIIGNGGGESQTSRSESRNEMTKFDPKMYPHQIKEYSVPLSSNGERIFSAKLREVVTSSTSAISKFERHSSVKGEDAFSPKFITKSTGEGSKSSFASSESASAKFGTPSKSENLDIYYKAPPSRPDIKDGIPYSEKSLRYVVASNTDLSHETPVGSGGNVAPFNAEGETHFDFESGVIKSFEDFSKSKGYAIYYKIHPARSDENLRNFLKPTTGRPRNHEYSSEFGNGESHLFLGLPSSSTASRQVFNVDLSTSLGGAPDVLPVVVQSNSPVSPEYELPIINFGTAPVFLTDSEVKENSKKFPIIYESSPVKPATEYGVPNVVTPPYTIYGTPSSLSSDIIDIRRPINKPFAEYGLPTFKPTLPIHGSPGDNGRPDIEENSEKVPIVYEPSHVEYGVPNVVTPPSTIYGTPSSLSSNVDIRRPINKPFAEYGLPIFKPTLITHGSPGDNGRPDIEESSEKAPIIFEPSPVEYGVPNVVTPPSTIYGAPSSLSSNIDIRRPINKPFAEYGLPTVKPTLPTHGSPGGDNGRPDIDVRNFSKPRVVFLKSSPSLEYGTPNTATRIEPSKQTSEGKSFEFGVPVLKAPNTRPLSSYEVPIY